LTRRERVGSKDHTEEKEYYEKGIYSPNADCYQSLYDLVILRNEGSVVKAKAAYWKSEDGLT
jgi:hypothetical protein